MILDLIPYGLGNHLDISKIRPINNQDYRNKPSGGLWSSPINSNFGWKDWCECEQFQLDRLETHFTFSFNGNVLTINSPGDLYQMPWIATNEPFFIQYPDFEKLAKSFDAIWLTDLGQDSTRFSKPNLYGWDCESVLIMNPTKIILHGEKL